MQQSCTVVTVSATLLLMSKYSIKKSNLSGLWVLGIGTFILNSSGENPVSIAGLRDKSLINHSPDSTLICNIVSTFAVLSKLNFGVKVCSIVSKFCIPSISSSSCKTTGWPPSESDSSAPKYVCELNSFEVFMLDPDKWKYSLPAFLTLPSIDFRCGNTFYFSWNGICRTFSKCKVIIRICFYNYTFILTRGWTTNS